MKKAVTVMAMVIALAMSTMAGAFADELVNTEGDFEQTYLAAPAVAGLLLEDAGIDNRYGSGRTGGNFIRDVAQTMGPETHFLGVAKTSVTAYECAVAEFLISQGADVVASGTGVIDTDASGATATDNGDGTVTLEISVTDACGDGIVGLDPLTDFSVSDSVIGGNFFFGTTSIPGSGATEWSSTGGTYSVTLERNFFDSRPVGYYADGWYRVWDVLVDGHLVEDDLVLQTTYSAVADWIGNMGPDRWITIQTMGELGGVFGIGSDPGESETGTIVGTIDGQAISMVYERTDIDTTYSAAFEGSIANDGLSMSGTWTDTNGRTGNWYFER